MKITNETKIGALAAVSITILILGYNFLKGNEVLSKSYTLYAVYDQVEGLYVSDPVLVNGLSVGKVRSLEISKNRSAQIIAGIAIENDLNIPTNTVAKITSSDLLGSKVISLLLGDSDSIVNEGDTLQSAIQASLSQAVTEQIAPVKIKAENLLEQIDSVLTIVQIFLNKKTQDKFHRSFTDLETTMANFSRTSSKIDALLARQTARIESTLEHAESIMANLKENNKLITNIIQNISDISDSVSGAKVLTTINDAQAALAEFAELIDKINNGEGSLGMLIQDNRLYDELANSAQSLDNLLVDLKKNPKRYVKLSVISIGGGKSKKGNEGTSAEK